MTLYNCLYMYAMEEVFQHAAKPHQDQRNDLRNQIEQASEQLQRLGPEASALARRLDSLYWDYLDFIEETALLAGISVGLDLRRLGG